MGSFGKYVRSVVRFIGYLGMASVVAIMLIMSADVVLRYVFNKPFLWSFDAVEYIMVFCVFFGLAYTELLDGHVNITLVFDYFPSRIKPFVTAINHLIMLGLGVLMVWQGYLLTADSFRVHRTATGAVKIPEGPFDAAIIVGGLAFSLLLIVKLYEDFLQLKNK